MSYLHREPIALGPGQRPAVLVVDFIEGKEAVGDRSALRMRRI